MELPADITDMDNDGDTIEPIPYDYFGNNRITDHPGFVDTGVPNPNGNTVDIGAYEYNPLDDMPVIAAMSNVTADEGNAYVSAVPVLTSGQFTDVTWTLVSGPAGMTIDETTGQVSWNPTVASNSVYTIIIRATNDYGYDEESWNLSVPVTYTAIVQTDTDYRTIRKFNNSIRSGGLER